MPYLRFLIVWTILNCTVAQLSHAQEPPKSPATAPAIDNAFVQKAFGASCTLIGSPSLVADLNGDGIDDVVIPAKCKNPMMDQTENNFTVIDPYYTFFGYGDPKVSTQFSTEVPERRGLCLLVIHGSGKEAWRSSTPLAKFVIVNMPFKEIMLKKLMVHKKRVTAIYVQETGADEMTSAVFWDGKKYRYEPMGASME